MGAAEWLQRSRALRRELAVVESGVATEEEQNEAYIAGLRRELEGWVQIREHGLALGNKHELLRLGPERGEARVREVWGLELAEEAEQCIVAIEAEIERVSGG